jgi:hypothetical protein
VPLAIATNLGTTMNNDNVSVPITNATAVNNAKEVSSNITNTTPESGLPQSNPISNEPDKGDVQLSGGPQQWNVTIR